MYLLDSYFFHFGGDFKHHVCPDLRDQLVKSMFMVENPAAWWAGITQVIVVEKPLVSALSSSQGM